jgi:phage-related minor tail protein
MDGAWVTYAEAAARLNVSVEAVRQRAIRNKWARTLGNDKRARVRLPDEPYPPQTPVIRPTESALLDALREHIVTLKTDIERLTAELAGERAAHQDQLAAERAARQADQEHAATRQADQDQQLAAARAASDRATAELVELARRLAAIAETQASAETAEAEPEPPRRSAVGRAWRWFLRN